MSFGTIDLIFSTNMILYIRSLVPESTIGNQCLWFDNFGEADNAGIELPGFIFLSPGNTDLNVVKSFEMSHTISGQAQRPLSNPDKPVILFSPQGSNGISPSGFPDLITDGE
jgi:hypothetical protein